MSAERVAVLGGGSWGTALAHLLASKGHDVLLWGRSAAQMSDCETRRENTKYLPGATFPPSLHATSDLAGALADRRMVVSVVPSQMTRAVWEEARQFVAPGTLVIGASKGIENQTLETMDEVLASVAPTGTALAYLSGPSFAREVGQSLPTAVVMASHHHDDAERAAELFRAERFRVYTTDDVVGVEMGGALKNVMAIAAGMVDGMALGHNTRAALITRGLAEISRLAVRRGANPLTLAGLAGLGDLILTCTGDQSRNRTVGFELGQGRSIDDILAGMSQVAEGVKTTKSAYELAEKLGVDMPITQTIYRVLYDKLTLMEAIGGLMGRAARRERD